MNPATMPFPPRVVYPTRAEEAEVIRNGVFTEECPLKRRQGSVPIRSGRRLGDRKGTGSLFGWRLSRS